MVIILDNVHLEVSFDVEIEHISKYQKCFKCYQMGHLTEECPQNQVAFLWMFRKSWNVIAVEVTVTWQKNVLMEIGKGSWIAGNVGKKVTLEKSVENDLKRNPLFHFNINLNLYSIIHKWKHKVKAWAFFLWKTIEGCSILTN